MTGWETPLPKKINAADFEAAKKAAQLIGVTHIFHALPERHAEAITQEYAVLRGDTQSPAGLFGALDNMTADMVGPSEIAWFHKCAQYARHAINALLDRDSLDDPNLSFENIVRRLNVRSLNNVHAFTITILELKKNLDAIEKAFPPETAQGLSR